MSERIRIEPDAIHFVDVPFREVPQSKPRPAIIDRIGHDGVRVWPIYSKPGRNRVPIRATFETGLPHDSFVQREAITVDAQRVYRRIGNLPNDPILHSLLAS